MVKPLKNIKKGANIYGGPCNYVIRNSLFISELYVTFHQWIVCIKRTLFIYSQFFSNYWGLKTLLGTLWKVSIACESHGSQVERSNWQRTYRGEIFLSKLARRSVWEIAPSRWPTFISCCAAVAIRVGSGASIVKESLGTLSHSVLKHWGKIFSEVP